jgi:hypothetical protein
MRKGALASETPVDLMGYHVIANGSFWPFFTVKEVLSLAKLSGPDVLQTGR